MFHGGWLRGVSVIFGYFIGNGQNPSGAIAPNTGPMLDSGPMCASASQLFAASRSLPRPGSLALLLLLLLRR
jgi:hypothetical protein